MKLQNVLKQKQEWNPGPREVKKSTAFSRERISPPPFHMFINYCAIMQLDATCLFQSHTATPWEESAFVGWFISLTYRLGCWCICSCACCRGGWNALQWCSCQLYSAAPPRHKNYSNGKYVTPKNLSFISFCNSLQKPCLKYWYLDCWIEHKVLQDCPVWHGLLKLSRDSYSLVCDYIPLHRADCPPLDQQSIHLLDCVSCDASLCPLLGRDDRVPQRQEWPAQCKKLSTKPASTEAFDRWTTYLLITSQNKVSDI